MTPKIEGALAVLAAIFVLLSAMFDPRVSVVVSLVALLGYALYKLTERAQVNDA